MGDVVSRLEGFFLMYCFNNIIYEDIETWFVDSGSSHHVTRLREGFLRFIEIDSDCYVGLGAKTKHTVKGIGTVRFQLEAGAFPVIEHMLYILELSVNLFSGLDFEDGGYGITFQQGQVIISSVGEAHNATMVLGVKEERFYKYFG